MPLDPIDESPDVPTGYRPTDPRVDALAALVVDDSQPAIVVLSGGDEERDRTLVEQVVEKLVGWDQPAQQATLDLDGFEDARLADYLAYQVAKRCPELTDDGQSERVEALLAVVGEQMAPVFNATTLALLLSLALDGDDPVARLRQVLDLPPIPYESVPVVDPIILDQALRLLSEGRHTLVHIADPLLVPTALTGTEVGILSWLALASERHPKVTLVLSVDSDVATEILVPYSRGGVERVELDPQGAAGHGEAEEPTVALRRRLGAEGPHGEAVMGFLVEAALCGPVVPVVPLLDRLGLDEAAREVVEDVLDEVLVADGEKGATFVDLEFRHPGYPQGVLDGGRSTWTYRFRSAALRRALVASLDETGRHERARALAETFDRGLPTVTRSIARLRAHLARHLGVTERRQALQQLAWWIQPREAPFLRAVLERELRAGALDSRDLWQAAGTASHRPPLWRLAVLEACAVEGERFLEDLEGDQRRAIRSLLAELRHAVLAQRPETR